jgi:hypothetical protein
VKDDREHFMKGDRFEDTEGMKDEVTEGTWDEGSNDKDEKREDMLKEAYQRKMMLVRKKIRKRKMMRMTMKMKSNSTYSGWTCTTSLVWPRGTMPWRTRPRSVWRIPRR